MVCRTVVFEIVSANAEGFRASLDKIQSSFSQGTLQGEGSSKKSRLISSQVFQPWSWTYIADTSNQTWKLAQKESKLQLHLLAIHGVAFQTLAIYEAHNLNRANCFSGKRLNPKKENWSTQPLQAVGQEYRSGGGESRAGKTGRSFRKLKKKLRCPAHSTGPPRGEAVV